jgi:peptidyl-prolyl cis-trans isomerase D
MLDTLRNSARGTAGKVIVGLIVITFVLFGAESIISIAGNASPATVNGEDISEIEYQRLLSTRQQELTEQFGAEMAAQLANSPFLQEEIIESLISQSLQAQLADNLKFDASEDQILKTFADIPAFQIDGQFDQDRYLNVLAANGFNHQSFIAAQRNATALTQMQAGIANSAFAIEKSVGRYAALYGQQRSFSYKAFNASDYAADVQLSDDELQNYYLENETQYLSDEQVKVDYLVVDFDAIVEQQVVTETELQSAYDSYVASLSADEVREISHILFADGDDNLAEANAALDRLAAGEDFSELAAELSDDPGSAEFGGSLGELIPDVYVSEFYDAAVALSEVGELSTPVETQYGVHIIRLDDIAAIEADSLEQKREDLTASIKDRKARDEMLQVEAQLSDAAFSTDTIEAVAESFQTEVQTTDWFSRITAEGVFTQSSVLAEAFSEQVIADGLISNVVRLADNSLIALQMNDHAPEAVQPFDAVAEDVRTALTAVKATELMQADLESTTSLSGDGWVSVESAGRDLQDHPAEVVAKAFELAETQVGTTSGTETAYAVIVSDILTTEPSEVNLAEARLFADNIGGGTQYQIMYNQSRNLADITIRR